MIDRSRIVIMNSKQPAKGQYVLYWMQASQRAEYNHALEFAISQANERKQPLFVYFGLTDKFPEANQRHYHFMLEGLQNVYRDLNNKGIGLVVRHISPELGAVELGRKASLIVCDRGYLRIQKQWRQYVATRIECPLVQVESEVIVPVEEVSNREEYSAATLRHKLQMVAHRYLVPLNEEAPRIDSSRHEFASFDISDIAKAMSSLDIDRSVKPVSGFHGGTDEAKRRLNEFLDNRLEKYAEFRNDPNEDCLSNLSPYLHFGQISPLYVALQVVRHGGPGRDAFLEELLIRRELSMNFVHYNRNYDSFEGLPEWARLTLHRHRSDQREYVYPLEQLETAHTHDPYWNAAQNEMVTTGKMHGYMRMYWGKKILEWMGSPEEAFSAAIYLNNKYELDGRDPNGFAGVAWCFGKHDRPWGDRPIFGNVRYMSANGLKRKFDAEKYARRYASNNAQRPPEADTKDGMKHQLLKPDSPPYPQAEDTLTGHRQRHQ